jgi:DNA-binding MarR family transcriptional regulator
MHTIVPAGLFELLHAASIVESFVESRLTKEGLSLAKLAALTRLVEAGDSLPLGQLADRLACVKSNVTQLVDRLEADGFVQRAPDPNDRRSRLAVLTPEGRTAQGRGVAVQRSAEREIFGTLSETEATQLAGIVEKLSRAAS